MRIPNENRESSTGSSPATPATRFGTLQAGPIQSSAFAPDGKLVISIDGSDSVRVWDAGNGQLLQPQR
jgi:hypothetical protein